MTDELPQTAGDAIIEAVIRTGCLDAEEVEGADAVIFIWAANSAEQLEAAIEDLGYRITKK